MTDPLLRAAIAVRIAFAEAIGSIYHEEEGEGVISAAIAVLIMAFLGAAMWVAFNAVFQDASGKISSQVGQIGG